MREKSKFLSLVLRHKPEKIGLVLDKNGWADVGFILKKLNLTSVELKSIVENNNKQRFSFNEDGTKIRANQGHTIDVNVELVEVKPPDRLFHGTSKENLRSIKETGINRGQRNHVHLSEDISTATSVGSRHGVPALIKIDTKRMFEDGIKFYLSKNRVYLTEYVDSKYLLWYLE